MNSIKKMKSPFLAVLFRKTKKKFSFAPKIEMSPRRGRVSTRIYQLAERVGFEPTGHLRSHMFSRHADSTTLAPLP